LYEQKVTFNMYGDIVSKSKPLSGIPLEWRESAKRSTNAKGSAKRSKHNKLQY